MISAVAEHYNKNSSKPILGMFQGFYQIRTFDQRRQTEAMKNIHNGSSNLSFGASGTHVYIVYINVRNTKS
jgi:hypothetical protein